MTIKEKRLKKNITQADLAQLLGVSRATVTKWELGTAHPKAEDIPKIADVLGCSIDELYGRGKREREDTSSTNLVVGPPSPAREGLSAIVSEG